jgi:hypothetical protein
MTQAQHFTVLALRVFLFTGDAPSGAAFYQRMVTFNA